MLIATTTPPDHRDRAEPRPKLRAVTPPDPDRELLVDINGIGVVSAARTAAILSLVVALAVVASGVVLWWAGRRTGLIDWLEQAVADGLGLDAWALPADGLLLVWIGMAAAFAVLSVIVVALLAVVFNQLARSVGGVHLRAMTRDVDRSM